MQVLAQTDTLDLRGSFRHGARFLVAIEAQCGATNTSAAPQVRTQRDVIEHRHRCNQPDVLKRATHAATGNVEGLATADRFPIERDGPPSQGQRPADQVEHGALACTVGPDKAEDFAGSNFER